MELSIRREDNEREVRIQLQGVVDLDAAALLKSAATNIADGHPVVLDFRGATVTSDAALGMVVAAIGSADIACVGLSNHHEKLLKYLGVSAACATDIRK